MTRKRLMASLSDEDREQLLIWLTSSSEQHEEAVSEEVALGKLLTSEWSSANDERAYRFL